MGGGNTDRVRPLHAYLYGEWQTEKLARPVAKGGKVPKDERGQVRIWDGDMSFLPVGTVHLPLPRIASTAGFLGIDYAPCMTGFDHHGGRSTPRIEGIVVCSEFEEILRQAHVQRERNHRKKQEDTARKRVCSNWATLIRSVLVRHQVMRRIQEQNQLRLNPGAQISHVEQDDVMQF